MSPFRGIVLVAAGIVALWRGWTTHLHRNPLTLYGLGVLAIALGAWHLLRRPENRLR